MDAVPDLEDATPVLEEVVDAASDLKSGLRLRVMFGIGKRHFVFKLSGKKSGKKPPPSLGKLDAKPAYYGECTLF